MSFKVRQGGFSLNLLTSEVGKSLKGTVKKVMGEWANKDVLPEARSAMPKDTGATAAGMEYREFPHRPGGVLFAPHPAWFFENGTVKQAALGMLGNGVRRNSGRLLSRLKGIVK